MHMTTYSLYWVKYLGSCINKNTLCNSLKNWIQWINNETKFILPDKQVALWLEFRIRLIFFVLKLFNTVEQTQLDWCRDVLEDFLRVSQLKMMISKSKIRLISQLVRVLSSWIIINFILQRKNWFLNWNWRLQLINCSFQVSFRTWIGVFQVLHSKEATGKQKELTSADGLRFKSTALHDWVVGTTKLLL